VSSDQATAQAFADSWNHVGDGSVYSREQFLEWFEPLRPGDYRGREVLELGFGNGSLLYHFADYGPRRLCGVELGETREQTLRNLQHVPPGMLDLRHGDLTRVDVGQFDLVYCIGVLHHLQDPEAGFRAVLRATRPDGRFHCWVYAREGNAVVRWLVEPLRRLASRLPWWLTKYLLAAPLSLPFLLYAKGLAAAGRSGRAARWLARLPLYRYCLWIAPRPPRFFLHVAFDQLVTPRTVYLPRATIERWLEHPEVAPESRYLVWRNQNSWKFGGIRRPAG
jgi:SAM-dependent methyltransferase